MDEVGTVRLRLWYKRERKNQPLEIVLGNPASQVLKTLKNALNEEARATRLSLVTGSSRVEADSPSKNKDIVK